MYEYGVKGVQEDYSKAAELYKKACDMGYTEGCERYTKLNRGY
jgi:TPR repeat protein